MRNFLLLLFCVAISVECYSDVEWNLNTYLFFYNREVADTQVNPYNRAFNIPLYQGYIDLRPEAKWEIKNNKLIVRPRWLATYLVIEDYLKNEKKNEGKGEVNLSDLFVETIWGSSLITTLGLQVYQWGPAELLSPTNPLFHFNRQQRSPFYKEKGQVLIRANISLENDHSLVLIFQPNSNNEKEWQQDVDFTAKGLVKFEKSWRETPNYVGVLAGVAEERNFFIGEYGNIQLAEGFTLYIDAKHQQNKSNFAPKYNGYAYDLVRVDSTSQYWKTLATVGLRYESNLDFRLEYIFNEPGYNQREMEQAVQAITPFSSLNYSSNLQKYLRPGLELLGKQYIYYSIRVSEPREIKDFNFYNRGIISLQDSSFQIQAEADYALSDSWNGFAGFSQNFGRHNSEFKILNNWEAMLGLKHSL